MHVLLWCSSSSTTQIQPVIVQGVCLPTCCTRDTLKNLTTLLFLLSSSVQSDLSHPLAQIDLVFSALFMLDCILNFRTAFVGEHNTARCRTT